MKKNLIFDCKLIFCYNSVIETCVQAVLNPLQAFLNSIVYRGVGLCYQRFMLTAADGGNDDTFSRPAEHNTSLTGMNADESSPLLRTLNNSLRVS